jgi:hypothetical protein
MMHALDNRFDDHIRFFRQVKESPRRMYVGAETLHSTLCLAGHV